MSRQRTPPPGGNYSRVQLIEMPIILKPGETLPPPVVLLSDIARRKRRRRTAARFLHRVAALPDSDRAIVEMVVFRKMSAKQVATELKFDRKEVRERYLDILGRLTHTAPPPSPPG